MQSFLTQLSLSVSLFHFKPISEIWSRRLFAQTNKFEAPHVINIFGSDLRPLGLSLHYLVFSSPIDFELSIDLFVNSGDLCRTAI